MDSPEPPLPNPRLEELISEPGPAWLGPEPRPGRWPAAKIDRALGAFFAEESVDEARRPLFRSAALLWHDHLDASHTISQDIGSRDGDLLHGIMHRREPDYGNAKYWFHRVGAHPSFAGLLAGAKASGEIAKSSLPFIRETLAARLWDPFSFIDACEEAAALPDSRPEVAALRAIQEIEIRSALRHFLDA